MSHEESGSVAGSPSPPPCANIVVVAGGELPFPCRAGPYPSHIHVGVRASDTPASGLVLQVFHRDGRIILPNDVTDQWLLHVQPARDRHEQNVECFRDKKGQLYLRGLRSINKGEQLMVWYSDELARQSEIPVLTPDNIRGNQQYTCTNCGKTFLYPNSLKAHIRFRCRSEDSNSKTDFPSSFSVRSMLNLSTGNDRSPLPSIGELLTDKNKTSPSKESIKNWLLLRTSANRLPTSSLSAFTPTNRTQDGVKLEPDTEGSGVDTHPKRPTDTGALNLTVGGASSHQPASLSGVSQPIQIFNHIHPPAYPIAIDHGAVRLYYPYMGSMHGQSPRLCCEQREECVPQYGRHLLMTATPTKLSGPGLPPQCYPSGPASTPQSMAYPYPMPSESEGEPLDLIPRSLFTSKSRKGHLCIYCGKLYSRKYGLKIHLRTHTGYKPLKCKVCLRPFGDPSNLNKHVRLHAEGDTPYRCEYCGKVLVRRRDLERHVRSRHPDEVEKKEMAEGEEEEEEEEEEGSADTTTDESADTSDIVVT